MTTYAGAREKNTLNAISYVVLDPVKTYNALISKVEPLDLMNQTQMVYQQCSQLRWVSHMAPPQKITCMPRQQHKKKEHQQAFSYG